MENIFYVIIKIEKKNIYIIDLYLLFPKNLENIKVVNSYYF